MNFYNAGDINLSGEKKLLSDLRQKIDIVKSNEKLVFFDVGAATGEYSECILNVFSELDISIHLFEPTKSYRNELEYKFSNNLNVSLNLISIGDDNKEATLYCTEDAKGINSIYDRARDFQKNKVEVNTTYKVEMSTLDDYCIEHDINSIFFLKIDTEGNEFDCLNGAYELLKDNKIYSLLFEFGGANVDAKTFFYDFWTLLNNKFNLFRVGIDGLYPIKNYDRKLEIFISINYFAVLKKQFQ